MGPARNVLWFIYIHHRCDSHKVWVLGWLNWVKLRNEMNGTLNTAMKQLAGPIYWISETYQSNRLTQRVINHATNLHTLRHTQYTQQYIFCTFIRDLLALIRLTCTRLVSCYWWLALIWLNIHILNKILLALLGRFNTQFTEFQGVATLDWHNQCCDEDRALELTFTKQITIASTHTPNHNY